jgi:cephalosporin hydroxylase
MLIGPWCPDKCKFQWSFHMANILKRTIFFFKDILSHIVNAKEMFHLWYYRSGVWETTYFMGIHCCKSVTDIWNYQEIIYQMKAALIVEFGSLYGGSTLFFSTIQKMVNPDSKVISVDINHDKIPEIVRQDPHIELISCSSTDTLVENRLKELRNIYRGPMFTILDSDHSKKHVLKEMEMLRGILIAGDYLIVEDSNVSGHPVRPDFGDGPMEAMDEYMERYPDDYERDIQRENKFGFTFAPKGFLIKK